MPEPTLAEIGQQIEVLETAQAFGQQLQEFTDFLADASGANVTGWLTDDPTVKYELDQLKDAALQFSETLQGAAEVIEPIGKAAETAGNINTAVQTIRTFADAVARAEESTGAEKASQLADVISGVSDLAKLLTGLSINPVIGVFIGLYATALQSAAVGLEIMDAYATRRNEIVASRGGEMDLEAALAEREARAASAEEAQLELTRQLNDLYVRRGEVIAGLQAGQYRAALDFCASRNREALSDLIDKASKHGGIHGNATPNGASLERVEEIVTDLSGAAFDLMTQAQAAPEGSEARAELTRRAEDVLDTKQELIEFLGPFRDCVTEALETYGYSTADAGSATSKVFGLPRRLVFGGGAGILGMAMLGVVIVVGGGSDDNVAGAGPGNATSTGASANQPAATEAAGACEVAHARQDLIEQFTSPDVLPSIPATYTRRNGAEGGFQTPRFEWGSVPAETTEIAVLVQDLTSERGVEYPKDDRLWWNQKPIGATVWLVTGIDASATSLPVTSLTQPPPGNAVERKHENGRYTLDGTVYEQQFWINSSQQHLFTVFALCDPPLAGTLDDYNHVWLLRNAVGIGWFFSALE